MIEVYRGRTGRHIDMGMSLHMDVVEALIVCVLHQPLSVLLGIHLNRGSGDLLRINHDVFDDVLIYGFVSCTMCNAMPSDLLIKLFDEECHLRPCSGSKDDSCFSVATSEHLCERQFPICKLCKLQSLFKICTALSHVLFGHLNGFTHFAPPPLTHLPAFPAAPTS